MTLQKIQSAYSNRKGDCYQFIRGADNDELFEV
jgi:hypothetical protein